MTRWSDHWGNWFARVLVWGTGALALAFAINVTPWADPVGAVIAIALVAAGAWGLMLAILWLPVLGVAAFIGLCLDAAERRWR